MQGKGYYKFNKVDHHVHANLPLFMHYFSGFIGLCFVRFLCQPFLFPLVTSLWADNRSHLTQPSTLGANVGGSTTRICPLTSWNNTNRGRIIDCSKKMKDCGALCYSRWQPWSLGSWTHGIHHTIRKNSQRAKFKSPGHMECIKPKKKKKEEEEQYPCHLNT